jgi:hypothetical protein
MIYENVRKIVIMKCIWIWRQNIILFLKFKKNKMVDVVSALRSIMSLGNSVKYNKLYTDNI